MTTNRRFSLALQALAAIKTGASTSRFETARSKPSQPVLAAPSLSTVLTEIGALPSEALFLGVASDGFPVLLNLYDPHPGPMLISGDAGSGKTTFLQTIAHSISQTHRSNDVEFGVITNYPDEWESTEATAHCIGVFPIGHNSTREFVHSLSTWAHSNKNTHQCVLLLIDDLESVVSFELEAIQDFRWLLLRGPARRVWPIVTLNAERYGHVIAWLQMFRTRIFGRVTNERIAAALGAAPLWTGRSRFDILALFEAADEIRALTPGMEALAAVEARGVIVTAPGREYDFVSRFFAPGSGTAEDPVTGSAHCALGPYWAPRVGKRERVADQASGNQVNVAAVRGVVGDVQRRDDTMPVRVVPAGAVAVSRVPDGSVARLVPAGGEDVDLVAQGDELLAFLLQVGGKLFFLLLQGQPALLEAILLFEQSSLLGGDSGRLSRKSRGRSPDECSPR